MAEERRRIRPIRFTTVDPSLLDRLSRRGPRGIHEFFMARVWGLRGRISGRIRELEAEAERGVEEARREVERLRDALALLRGIEEAARRLGLLGYVYQKALQAARRGDWDVRFPELEALPDYPAKQKLLAAAYAMARYVWAPYRNMNIRGVLVCTREDYERIRSLQPGDRVRIYGYAEAFEVREWDSRGGARRVRARAIWKDLGVHRLRDADWDALRQLFRLEIGEDPDCVILTYR